MVVAGCGYGSEPARRESFQQSSATIAGLFETAGSAVAADKYANVSASLALSAEKIRADGQSFSRNYPSIRQSDPHSPCGASRCDGHRFGITSKK